MFKAKINGKGFTIDLTISGDDEIARRVFQNALHDALGDARTLAAANETCAEAAVPGATIDGQADPSDGSPATDELHAPSPDTSPASWRFGPQPHSSPEPR
jgi:hypothetical protein